MTISKKRCALLVSAMIVAAVYAGYFLVCASPSGPIEAAEVGPQPAGSIAPFEEALTFARLGAAGGSETLLLVTGEAEDAVVGIDLAPLLGGQAGDAFDAIRRLGRPALIELARNPAGMARRYGFERLMPAAQGENHIAFGTNFADHGEEVNNEGVFAFPKFTRPTAALGAFGVDAEAGLFDYEVELCMRFDRDIRSIGDFDAALKGVFLCGDFTDRAALLRNLPDEENLSGLGFSDAKSGLGRMPTGPYLVVPEDWRRFVSEEAIATVRNGTPMQSGSGAEMILDFRQMAGFVLEAGNAARWMFEGRPVPLTPEGVIRQGTVLLSGTPAGILFRPPTEREIGCGAVAYVCLAGFLSVASPRDYVIERAIERGLESRRFLQPGDRVEHSSSRLGRIAIAVIATPPE